MFAFRAGAYKGRSHYRSSDKHEEVPCRDYEAVSGKGFDLPYEKRDAPKNFN
jgi:hypothetical protein